jgi:hypothetical protein
MRLLPGIVIANVQPACDAHWPIQMIRRLWLVRRLLGPGLRLLGIRCANRTDAIECLNHNDVEKYYDTRFKIS